MHVQDNFFYVRRVICMTLLNQILTRDIRERKILGNSVVPAMFPSFSFIWSPALLRNEVPLVLFAVPKSRSLVVQKECALLGMRCLRFATELQFSFLVV